MKSLLIKGEETRENEEKSLAGASERTVHGGEFSMFKFMCVYYCTVRERNEENAHCKLLCNTALHSNRMEKMLSEMLSVGRRAINSGRRRHEDIYTMHKNCFK